VHEPPAAEVFYPLLHEPDRVLENFGRETTAETIALNAYGLAKILGAVRAVAARDGCDAAWLADYEKRLRALAERCDDYAPEEFDRILAMNSTLPRWW